ASLRESQLLLQQVANFYSLKTEKIPTGTVALGDWLGCYRPQLPARGGPRAHPDPGTPEAPAPLEPLAARRSASGPARSFSGPLQGGARGGPRSFSRSPSPTPSPARPPDPRGAAALRSDSGRKRRAVSPASS
ncbi:unnamed protein product, partial [Rangifer tarandus platyrhynchus]